MNFEGREVYSYPGSCWQTQASPPWTDLPLCVLVATQASCSDIRLSALLMQGQHVHLAASPMSKGSGP